jgi:hypothetical protein
MPNENKDVDPQGCFLTARDDPEEFSELNASGERKGLLARTTRKVVCKKMSALKKRKHKTRASQDRDYRSDNRPLTTTKDDPEQVWKEMFQGSVGTDDRCQRCWTLRLQQGSNCKG